MSFPENSPGPEGPSEKQRAKARRVPASTSLEDTGIFLVFHFIPLSPLSNHVPGPAPTGRACGAEGGRLGLSCPSPASVSSFPALADFCAEAKTLFPEGSTGAAHRRGYRSNPCCLSREEGEAEYLRSRPRPPLWPGRNGTRNNAALYIFPRAKLTLNPSGAVGSRPGPRGSPGGAARPHALGGSQPQRHPPAQGENPPCVRPSPVLTLPPCHRPPLRRAHSASMTSHGAPGVAQRRCDVTEACGEARGEPERQQSAAKRSEAKQITHVVSLLLPKTAPPAPDSGTGSRGGSDSPSLPGIRNQKPPHTAQAHAGLRMPLVPFSPGTQLCVIRPSPCHCLH